MRIKSQQALTHLPYSPPFYSVLIFHCISILLPLLSVTYSFSQLVLLHGYLCQFMSPCLLLRVWSVIRELCVSSRSLQRGGKEESLLLSLVMSCTPGYSCFLNSWPCRYNCFAIVWNWNFIQVPMLSLVASCSNQLCFSALFTNSSKPVSQPV